ncbi:hypothetical protein Hamer_G008623, partial [Homarus americanus]
IVVFPPGRKRRSIVDLILQVINTPTSHDGQKSTLTGQDQTPTATGQRQKEAPERLGSSLSQHVIDAMTASLRLLVAATTEGVGASLEAAGVGLDWGPTLCPTSQLLTSRGGSEAQLANIFRAVSRRWTNGGNGGMCPRRRHG